MISSKLSKKISILSFIGVAFFFSCNYNTSENYNNRFERVLNINIKDSIQKSSDTLEFLYMNTSGCNSCKLEDLNLLGTFQLQNPSVYLIIAIPENKNESQFVELLLKKWRNPNKIIFLSFGTLKNAGLIIGSNFYARAVYGQVDKFNLKPLE